MDIWRCLGSLRRISNRVRPPEMRPRVGQSLGNGWKVEATALVNETSRLPPVQAMT